MTSWEQAALLDDDLQPIVRRPTRAEVARVRAEIQAHKDAMAAAEASLKETPAGGVPRNRLLEELREEIARPIEPRDDDEDDIDTSYVANIAGSGVRRFLDQQNRLSRIGTGYQFKGLLDGVLTRNATTFAGVSASVASGALPHLRAWEPVVDMTSRVGADARLHALGSASLASLPAARTSVTEMFERLAPTSPAFTSLLTTADLARRTIEETTGLLGTATSARSMLDALMPGFNARTSIAGLIDDLALSSTYKNIGLPTTYEAAVLGLGSRVLPSRVDMTSLVSGFSAPAALARLEHERFDSLRQEVLDTWTQAIPGLDVDVDALLGRFAPFGNVPPGGWEDVHDDDFTASLTSDVEHSLTDPDPQTLQRVLAAEQRQEYLEAHLHLWTSLDDTLTLLGFTAEARERMAPLMATSAAAAAFLFWLLDAYTGEHVRKVKDSGASALKTYKKVDDWARGK